jgi:hypothetical protein
MDHRLGAVFKVDKGLSRNNLNIFAGLFIKFLRCDTRNPDYRDPLRSRFGLLRKTGAPICPTYSCTVPKCLAGAADVFIIMIEEKYVLWRKRARGREDDGVTKRPGDKGTLGQGDDRNEGTTVRGHIDNAAWTKMMPNHFSMPPAWMPLLWERPRCDSTGWGRKGSGKCEYMGKMRRDIRSL